ncbi:hypothetical protein [Bifidobacterium sp. UTBIF-78]|nr:hypothetical protein [Bifidobacterium sp. UTBIF-78]
MTMTSQVGILRRGGVGGTAEDAEIGETGGTGEVGGANDVGGMGRAV